MLNWYELKPWRHALIDSVTDTSVSVVLNDRGTWERHNNEYESLDAAKTATVSWAESALGRHGKLPDESHRN